LEGGIERGTQQENSYTKYAVTNRIPVAATLDRVKEASHQNLLTKVLGRTNYIAECFFRREWKASVAYHINKQTKFWSLQRG